MKVFISYGSAADQVTALRLQALGAVNGLTVYVPPAYTRQIPAAVINEESALKLNQADVILGVVGVVISGACWQELQASQASQKPTTVMAAPHVAPQLQPFVGSNFIVIVVDPTNPDQAELAIVQHLKNVEGGQRTKKALIALGTVALGLLVLAAFVPQD